MTTCDYIALATSGIQGLSPYVPGKPAEELQRELGLSHIVKLASNENPLGPSALSLEAMKNELSTLALYPDGNGFELKSALSNYLQVHADQITLGNGSNDILDLIVRAYAGPEDEVIYSEHAFAVYALSTQSVGAKAVVSPALNWGHDLDAMRSAITDRTKLIFIANPNNPTGTWLDSSAVESFLDAVPANVVVVLDEAYCEYIEFDEYPNGVSLLSKYPNLIVTRTFSKAWGLAGLRVGYSVSGADIADVLNRVRQPFNVNSMALAAASAVLKDTAYLAKSKEVNAEGLIQLENGFTNMGLDFIPSVGNFICFDTGRDGMEVFQALLKEGVIVRPVANYGMPKHLRVSVGLPKENEAFLDALKRVL